MSVHDIDPQPKLDPKTLTSDSVRAFELAMEQWFARRSMSWGSTVDYRRDRERRMLSLFEHRIQKNVGENNH